MSGPGFVAEPPFDLGCLLCGVDGVVESCEERSGGVLVPNAKRVRGDLEILNYDWLKKSRQVREGHLELVKPSRGRYRHTTASTEPFVVFPVEVDRGRGDSSLPFPLLPIASVGVFGEV